MDLSPAPNPDPVRRPGAVFHTWAEDTADRIAESIGSFRDAGFSSLVFQPRATREGDLGNWRERLEACLIAALEEGECPLRVWLGEDAIDVAVRERRGAEATGPVALRMETCATADRADALKQQDDIVGVYVGALADGSRLAGLEPWDEECEPPSDDTEVFLVVRRVSLLPRVESVLPSRAEMAVVMDALGEMAERFGDAMRDGSFEGIVWRLPEAGDAWAGCAPWCEELADAFEARWGEPMVPLLPCLWLDGPAAAAFRVRYRTVIAELYQKRVLDPLGEWCRAHALSLAVMEGRNDLLSQLRVGPGPVGWMLETADIPSAALTDPARKLAARQVRSIAHQAGRDRVWFRGMYRAGFGSALARFASEARQAVLAGASSVQVEWGAASLRGDAARLGCGALLRPEQPWWEALRTWADEAARLSQWLAGSHRRVEVLVLSPSESVMALDRLALPEGLATAGSDDEGLTARSVSEAFEALLAGLDVLQVDYDLVEEQTLADVGRPQANAFLVGRADYSLLVIPPALSWREETVRAIRRYAHRGGAVIMIDPVAPQIGFEPSGAFEALEDEFQNVFKVERAGRDVAYLLRRLDPPAVQVRDLGDAGTNDLIVLHQEADVYDCFCLLNASDSRTIQAQCRIDSEGVVRSVDASRGDVGVVYAREDGNAQVVEHDLAPGQVLALAVGGDRADLSEPAAGTSPRATSTLTLGGEWQFERTGPNVVALRNCGHDLGDRRANVPRPVDLLRAEFLSTPEMADGRRIELRFPFRSDLLMPRGVKLAVSYREGLEVRVNGEAVGGEWEACPHLAGWETLDITESIRAGGNEIALAMPAHVNAFEGSMLLGDFAVRIEEDGEIVLVEEPRTLNNGPWAAQGYPFYTGSMRYRQEFHLEPGKKHRVFLRVVSPSGSVLSARIGEHAPLVLSDSPHRVEITRLLVPGGNRVEIVLAGGLGNAFGPTHVAARAVDQSVLEPDVYDRIPAENRRLLEKAPRLESIGLPGGVQIETYDPDAPKPVAQVKKEPDNSGDSDES